jgi:hypothetical protein
MTATMSDVARGHEDRRSAGLCQDGPQLPTYPVAKACVEIAERLIEEDHLGLRGECPGQRHSLLLSPGQLVGHAVLETDQAHQFQDLTDPLPTIPPGQAVSHVPGHGHVREQGVVLEHHPDPPRLRWHEDARTKDRSPMDLDRAAGVFEAGDHTESCGLAAPRWAEQCDHTAFPDVEAEVVQGHCIAERPGQVTGADSESVSR